MPIGIPVGGRSTAIKLANGDLWVVVSTPLDTETRAKIDELGGQVKYIVGINAVHNLYLCKSQSTSMDVYTSYLFVVYSGV